MTWITDEKGNRASVEYWGSEEKARASLATLENCSGCSDCSRCSGCSRCSDCSDCSGCSRCSRCSDCSDCSGCSRCSGCSGCSGCSRCSRCSDCSDLKGASLVENGVTQNIPVVPVVEDLHAKVYAAATSDPEALNMGDWHTCETTHCRAGWVVTLAGDAGRELEKFHNTLLAAQLIYDASCPGYLINPARFFDTNEAALEDMRKLAEASK